jgi:hypothetical protein
MSSIDSAEIINSFLVLMDPSRLSREQNSRKTTKATKEAKTKKGSAFLLSL